MRQRLRARGDTHIALGAVLPFRHVAWNRYDSGQPARAWRIAADERPDHVDVCGDAQHEPAIVQRYHPVRASVAEHDDHRHYRHFPEQYAADANQHTGHVHVARGCSGSFGSVGTAQATRIEADFTGTDCDAAVFAGQLVLTKQ
jgi:hypothetical protein